MLATLRPLFLAMLCGLLSQFSLYAQQTGPSDAIIQGFYWNSNPGDITSGSGVWWDTLSAMAPTLADAGFRTVWTPPASKGFAGVYDMGYGIADYLDFGSFNQFGTVRTRHGSAAQLSAAITTMHAEGLLVMADVVLNHRAGAANQQPEDCDDGDGLQMRFTDFDVASGRFPMNAWDFHPNAHHCDLNGPYHDRSFFEDLCYFNFLDQVLDASAPDNGWYFGPHNLGRAGDSLIVYGRYLRDVMGFDEIRLDAVKHVEPGFLAPFLVELNNGPQPFVVGELFDGNLGVLKGYHDEVESFTSNFGAGSKDGNLAIFDFNLRYALRDMANNGSGGYNMWDLNSAGLLLNPGGGIPGEDIVTFVENHDVDRIGWEVTACSDPDVAQTVGSTCLKFSTDSGHDPVFQDKHLAYSYITAADGRPCIFWKDYFWYGLKEEIDWQLATRTAMAGGGTNTIQNLNSFFVSGHGGDLFVLNRYGAPNQSGLVLTMNDNPSAEASAYVDSPFSNVELKDYSDAYLFQQTTAFGDSRVLVKAGPRNFAWYGPTGLYPQPPGEPASSFNLGNHQGGKLHFVAIRAADAANLIVNGAPIEIGDEIAIVPVGGGDAVGLGRVGQSFRWDGVHDMLIEVLGGSNAGESQGGLLSGESFELRVYDQSAGQEFVLDRVTFAPNGTNFNFSARRPGSRGGSSPFALTTSAEGTYSVGGISLITAFSSCPGPGDLVISEIMPDPSAVSDSNGEWFEVYNPTGAPIEMMGMTIRDDGSDQHTIGSSLVVPAGGFVVLGRNGDIGTNGGVSVDYVYSSFTLGNSDDEVEIVCNMQVINRVAYDGGPNFPDPTGASMNLASGSLNATDNDNGANWCVASQAYGAGDLGTPGAANDSCNQPPTAVCMDITVDADAVCLGHAPAADFDGGSTDPDGDLLSFSVSPSGPYPLGTTNVTLTISDGEDTDDCTATITVEDNTQPVISGCPTTPYEVDNDPGVCGATINVFPPTAIDNCSLASTNHVPASGTFFPVGTTTATFTATDSEGNEASCMYEIVVVDVEAPVITCPANTTLDTDPDICGVVVSGLYPTATDNCDLTIAQTGGPALENALWGWGNSYSGGLGNGVESGIEMTPIELSNMTGWSQIAAGSYHSLALRMDGTLWAWGNNGGIGRLGIGNLSGVVSTPTQVGTASDWVEVATNNNHSLGIRANGTLWAWGNGGSGALGNGTGGIHPSPIQIGTATNWASVAAGTTHSLGIRTDGTLWAWGHDGQGELGDGLPRTTQNTPVQVGSWDDWVAIAAGYQFSLGIRADGTLWAWGDDHYGTLGTIASSSDQVSPVQVGTADNWASVSTHRDHVLAVRSDGTLWAWGRNQNGKLGIGSGSSQANGPTQVGSDANWVMAAAGYSHSLGLRSDGTVWAWGSGNGGGLGTGSFSQQNSPVLVGSEDDWSYVEAGSEVSFGLRSTGSVLPLGATTFSFEATDAAGNSATCSFTLTVVDDEPPLASCVDVSVQAVNGTVTISAADVDGGSSDHCSAVSLMVAPTSFNCSEFATGDPNQYALDFDGTTQRARTSTDLPALGADYTLEYFVYRKGGDDTFDRITGTATAALETALDGNGSLWFFNGAIWVNTNQVVALNTWTHLAWVVDAQGLNLYLNGVAVYTVNSSSAMPAVGWSFGGNYGGAQSTNTILDEVRIWDAARTAGQIQNNINVALSGHESGLIAYYNMEDGPGSSVLTDVTGNGFDAVLVDMDAASDWVTNIPGLAPHRLTHPTPIVLTVTDMAGNTSSCSAAAILVSEVTAVCRNITVQLDAAGAASIDAADLDGGSSITCGTPDLTADITAFDCSDVTSGPVTVMLTASDGQGNESSCTAMVTVEDVLPPLAECQDFTVQLDGAGIGSISLADIDDGSTDNCVGLSYQHPAYFTCSEIGNNTATLIVRDGSGNMSSCNATVTVEDNIAPTAVCQDVTVSLNAGGNGSIVAADIDGGSTDNCSVASISASPTSFDCSDVGTASSMLTVMDGSGNMDQCMANVTVVDNIAPTAVCQDVTVSLNVGGNGSIVAADIDGGSTDNCGVASISASPTSFDCSDVGTTSSTLTVTDVNGTPSTCNATVTVFDNVAPVANCQSVTVQLNASGTASILASDLNGGSTDNCNIASMSASPTSFDCSDVGTTSSTLTVTDVNGNATSCIAMVTVEDNIAPTAVCQDVTVSLNAGGSGSIVAADIDGGSTDNCNIASISASPTNFDCSDVGTTSSTLTVTDVNNNPSICTATVTVENNNPPTALCANITVSLGAGGVAIVPAYGFDGGSSSVCSTVSLSASRSTFTCNQLGTLSVILTVTDDGNGQTDNCTSMVTVQDPLSACCAPPAAVCNDVTVQLDASGNGTVSAAAIGAGSTAACGVASETVTPNTFDCSDLGTMSVTYTITDINNDSDNCMATVTVNDTEDPVVTCPADITVSNDPGECSGVVTFAPTATDNCPGVTTITDIPSGAMFSVGTVLVTATATDASGNTGQCSFNVTVNDTEDPVVTCPADITVSNDPGECSGVVTFAPTATDNCPGVTTITDIPSGAMFSVGTVLVTATATDASGNTGQCSFNVTVNDTEAPTVTCPADITVSNDPGECSGVVTFAPTATDNCPGVTTITDIPSGAMFSVGTVLVTATATDASGNTGQCSFNVTVNDTEDPVVTCPADITISNDPGECSGVVTFAPTATDNCPGVTTITDIPSGAMFSVGTVLVTATATDASGNTGQCSFNVTVNDTEAPTVTCPADITVSNDPGECSGVVTFAPTATDNCPGVTTITDIPSGAMFSVGTVLVTATATDASGNTGQCSFNVTVNDTEAPTVTCPADITVSNDPGECSGVVTFAPTATDNCPGVTTITDIPSGAMFSVGTVLVTATATDASGNTGQCSFNVTVNDTEAPTVTCPADITVNNDPGECSGVVTFAPTATDNCPGVTTITDIPSGAMFSVGTVLVTATATDASGNTGQCSFNVTVNDTERPTISCPADETISNDPGLCSAVYPVAEPTADDNCAVTVLRYRYRPVDEMGNNLGPWSGWSTDATQTLDVGFWRIQWQAKDEAGNQRRCSFIVTVEDTEDPVAICPASFAVENDPGECGADVEFGIDVSDNCPGATVVAEPVSGSFFPVGTTTVNVSATDVAGNTDACSFEVKVNDTEAPVIACAVLNITVPNDPGECEADVDLPVPGYTDNCEVVTVEFRYREVDEDNNPLGPWTAWMDESEASGTFAVGRYRIRWRIADAAGNTDACTRFLTVEDVEPPIITCTNSEVVFNGEEYIDLYVPDLATATDNCAVASVELDIYRIFCDELGEQLTITATATDVNGLTSMCTSKVDVLGLPCGWSQDPDGVGCEDGNAVSYSVPLDEFTVESTDCHNGVTTASDEYAFGQYTLCGDGMITAQVTSITGSPNGWAGVTMRGSNDPQAMMVSLLTNLGSQHRTETRLSYGGGVTSGLSPSFNRHWLRIQRFGNNFRGFVSFNGLSWFQKFNVYVPMGECIEMGLIVNSSSASGDNSATFAHVTVVGDPVYDTPDLTLQQWTTTAPQFSLYPNPTNGGVTIQLGAFLDQEGELEIMDVNGQRVRSVRQGLIEYATEDVDLSDLPAGLYFVRLRLADGTVQTQRIILQPRP